MLVYWWERVQVLEGFSFAYYNVCVHVSVLRTIHAHMILFSVFV